MNDREALRIHAGEFTSDSDSGKSDFDEEYYHYLPPPVPTHPAQIIVIRPVTSDQNIQCEYRQQPIFSGTDYYNHPYSGQHMKDSNSNAVCFVQINNQSVNANNSLKNINNSGCYTHQKNKSSTANTSKPIAKQATPNSSKISHPYHIPKSNINNSRNTSGRNGNNRPISSSSPSSNKRKFHSANISTNMLKENIRLTSKTKSGPNIENTIDNDGKVECESSLLNIDKSESEIVSKSLDKSSIINQQPALNQVAQISLNTKACPAPKKINNRRNTDSEVLLNISSTYNGHLDMNDQLHEYIIYIPSSDPQIDIVCDYMC